jgi:hypothetical protein
MQTGRDLNHMMSKLTPNQIKLVVKKKKKTEKIAYGNLPIEEVNDHMHHACELYCRPGLKRGFFSLPLSVHKGVEIHNLL